MTYEELLAVSDSMGLITKEKDLQAFDGRIKGRRVAIRRSITTRRKKACVLAEELGHYLTSSGNVLGSSIAARKQERRARSWAYDLQIGLSGLIRAKAAGCRNQYETADFLDVPMQFLIDCVKDYRERYGVMTQYQDYIIYFEPNMEIITAEENKRRINDW